LRRVTSEPTDPVEEAARRNLPEPEEYEPSDDAEEDEELPPEPEDEELPPEPDEDPEEGATTD